MTNTIISTDISGSETLDGDDHLLILEGASLTAPDLITAAITATAGSNLITVLGQVISLDAVALGSTGAGLAVYIGEAGNVLNLSASNAAIDITDPGAEITNHGTILGAIALVLQGDNSDLVNHGSIWSSGAGAAVDLQGIGSSLVNYGTIEASGTGLILGNDTNIRVLNHGSIIGATGLTQASASATRLSNYGQITGSDGTAIAFDGSDSKLRNFGHIDGDVSLTGDNSLLINAGTIVGDVQLGDGDATYITRGDALVTGTVTGGEGSDRILGGNADDNLAGGARQDTLKGRGGDDELDGGGSDDLVFGGAGEDTVLGGGGNDLIYGGAGNDLLVGGSGNDTIIGGDGDDELLGQTMADLFVFGRSTGNDTISDFEDGVDVIDLSAMDATSRTGLINAGAMKDVTGGVLIDLSLIGGDGTIFVAGMTVATMDHAEFMF